MRGDRRGVVVSFDEDRGFGFIRAVGFDEDVFVHVSSVIGGEGLKPGQRVRFQADHSDRGLRAVRVRPGSVGLPPALASSSTLIGAVVLASILLRVAGTPWIPSYLVSINLATLALWSWDKHRAVRDRRRVPEAVLLGMAAVGGTIGALAGVAALRHKRRKPRFLLGLGVISVIQALVFTWMISRP